MTLQTEGETRQLADQLAKVVSGGQVIGLQGDLGAGKTTLVRFLVGTLGGDEKDVSSPSFTLENEYATAHGQIIQHWDLYRLQLLPAELLEPPGPTVIRIVEWPDKIPGYVDTLDLVVLIRAVESGVREVSFSGPAAKTALEYCRKI